MCTRTNLLLHGWEYRSSSSLCTDANIVDIEEQGICLPPLDQFHLFKNDLKHKMHYSVTQSGLNYSIFTILLHSEDFPTPKFWPAERSIIAGIFQSSGEPE